VAETENALGQLGREERIRFLNQGMKLLDSEEQALLHMYYFDDFSVDDISIITGLGASNVKVKLFRTRKKLFECLHAILKDEVISIL
jgi:DNA-directed RNA polymerase specialized sigma subunit, sigma24 homolog